ncbi:interleukin-1 receptor-associated kinase 1 [Pundamilia nyererei]|uniref:Interleukin-1 receptor-associated kinase 1 n=1 Tax=Pundamilia nyererei TaxID=303518 RepID=A0A9Y3RQZ8_9CICH|nr:PREDICTED: interleukin-1 receptor-associated kinase 1 [Pundamilia nyererei]
MSGGDPRAVLYYNLPASVDCEFCRIMDGLSNQDWTRFASGMLMDQNDVRLAERQERRTHWVMVKCSNRNIQVGELIDLLEDLQLLRPRDVILNWVRSLDLYSYVPAPARHLPSSSPFSDSQFVPPPKTPWATPMQDTCRLGSGIGGPLPRPASPPPGLRSEVQQRHQPQVMVAVSSSIAVMRLSYEEVYAGTNGFSPSLQIGEGGFGVVYRATLKDMKCAVKKFKEDGLLDWALLKKSFQTEVEQLSRFRHRNIVDLLGFSDGGGSLCLIYSYMENRSLEDQLHNECVVLSWPQRVSVVKDASEALQFLHCPPEGEKLLIHGDVKSSNILLDSHMTAKLSDFGLARFVPTGTSAASTTSVGKTTTVRGTLAYLPEEYVRGGELGPKLDVYSFGVVLLEVLTGRRALEKDGMGRDRYLKYLVEDIKEGPDGSTEAVWRKHLDKRLISGGTAELTGSLQLADLACRCLAKLRRKRPVMKDVCASLEDVYKMVREPPYQSFPRPPRSLDSNIQQLSKELSKLGPLEDTYQVSQSTKFSSSPSLFTLATPDPLHSSSSLPPSSIFPPVSSCSFAGPCETDESRGFSQYDLRSQLRSNGTSCRSLSPSTKAQYRSPARLTEVECNQPSVPTEDQYNFPPQPNSTSLSIAPGALRGAPAGPETRGQTTADATARLYGFSPAGSLKSTSPEPSIQINSSKQRLLEKKTQYEEGRIRTPELLSSENIYEEKSSGDIRGPEESDELDYLPTKHK